MHDRAARNKKIASITTASLHADSSPLAGSSGTEAVWRKCCAWVSARYLSFLSLLVSAEGGLATLVPRIGSGLAGSNFDYSEPLPGRAARTAFVFDAAGSTEWVLWNMHNRGLDLPGARRLGALVP